MNVFDLYLPKIKRQFGKKEMLEYVKGMKGM